MRKLSIEISRMQAERLNALSVAANEAARASQQELASVCAAHNIEHGKALGLAKVGRKYVLTVNILSEDEMRAELERMQGA